MENTHELSFNLNSEQLEMIRKIFAEKMPFDQEKQNAFMEKLILLQAERQGFSPEQINLLKNTIASIDFSLDKTTAKLYKLTSHSVLSRTAEKAVKKVNQNLEQEENKEKDKEKEENKTEAKDSEKKIDFDISVSLDFIEEVLSVPKTEQRQKIYDNIKQQVVSQDYGEEVLDRRLAPGELDVCGKLNNGSKSLGEIIVDQVETTVNNYANTKVDDIEKVISDPKNRNKADVKLMVMAHLKEATEEEFNNYINLAGMKDFLGEKMYAEVLQARHIEQQLDESDKDKEAKEAQEQEETPESEDFNDEDKEKADLYGIDLSEVSKDEFLELVNEVETMGFVNSKRPD